MRVQFKLILDFVKTCDAVFFYLNIPYFSQEHYTLLLDSQNSKREQFSKYNWIVSSIYDVKLPEQGQISEK